MNHPPIQTGLQQFRTLGLGFHSNRCLNCILVVIFSVQYRLLHKYSQPFPIENSFRKNQNSALNKRIAIPPKRILSPILFSINLINCRVFESELCATNSGVPIKNRVCQVGEKSVEFSRLFRSLNFF